MNTNQEQPNHSRSRGFAWGAFARRLLLALVAVCALALTATSASALNILVPTHNPAGNVHLENWLTNQSHTVDLLAFADGAPGDGTYDLVIFPRNLNSGNYTGDDASWAASSTPQIHIGTYTIRTSRLGWVNTTNDVNDQGDVRSGTYDSDFTNSLSHPFFAGLTAADTNLYITDVNGRAYMTNELPPASTVLATYDGGMNAQIFTLPVGAPTYAGSGAVHAGKRYAFLFDGQNSNPATEMITNLNAAGLTVLSNMIAQSQIQGDTDGDGMPDDWEDQYNNTDKNVADSGLDPDGDGLINGAEYTHLSNPDLPDTDGDGINDGPEVAGSANPFFTPTDPTKADTDGDGIDDGDEINGTLNTGWGNAATDPANRDTDYDNMWDLYEINNNLIAPGLNPNDISDGFTDLDGDTLSNANEFSGALSAVQTRADKPDTDDDGYGDEVEDNFNAWFSVTATGTDPTLSDTDGDGLLDGQENQDLGSYQGTNSFPAWCDPNLFDTDNDALSDSDEMLVHHTDPQNLDTDGDTYSDGLEAVTFGTDPNDPLSLPSAEQLVELRVNFANPGNPTPLGWTNYVASHENIATFTPQTFAAFGVTNIVITPVFKNPDGSNSVNSGSFQLFGTRTLANAAAAGNQDLYRGWMGTDNRTEGSMMTLVVSNLPAGVYTWVSEHFDPQDRSETFNLVVNDANGRHVKVARRMASGNAGQSPGISRFKAVVVSDGVNSISVEIVDVGGVWSGLNAVNIRTSEPLPTDQPATILNIDTNGTVSVSFTPGGPGYTLNAATNLADGLSREINAVFDATNTFTLPAGYNDGQGYFQTELLKQTP